MADYQTLPDGNIRVPLPDGQHAEVRTLEDLRRADTRAILAIVDAEGVRLDAGGIGFGALAAMQDAVIVRMTRRWSLITAEGEPVPITAESVQDLRTVTHKALATATAPILAELMPSDPVSADPKSVSG